MALRTGVSHKNDSLKLAAKSVRLETLTSMQKRASFGAVGDKLWLYQRGIPVKNNTALSKSKLTQHTEPAASTGRQSMPTTQVEARKSTTAAFPIRKIPEKVVGMASNPKPQGSKLNIYDDESKAPRITTTYSRVEPVVGNLTKTIRGVGNALPSLHSNIPVNKRDLLLEQKLSHLSIAKPHACARRKSMPPTLAVAKKTSTAGLPHEKTPTRPPIQAREEERGTAALIFVEAKKLPYKVSGAAAEPDHKLRSSILNHPFNDECKVSSRDSTKSFSAKQLEVIDPDGCFKNDPAMVTEYVGDIFSYLRSMEAKFPVQKNFLEGHETLPWMRVSLIDWLVGVQEDLDLYLETLHLTVAIVDRYLRENKDVGSETLQLVGIASLLVACKYEEMYVPDFTDFLRICNNSFSKVQVLTMEKKILRQLDYSFGRPLSVHFLRRYNRIAQVPSNNHSLCKYLLELMLIEYDMSHVNPSMQAAAACCLSMGIMNGVMDLSNLWTPTLVYYTKYEYSEFEELIVSLANILVNSMSSKYQRVRTKYASSSHSKISLHANLTGSLVRMLTTTKK